jgi:hypothetical protein
MDKFLPVIGQIQRSGFHIGIQALFYNGQGSVFVEKHFTQVYAFEITAGPVEVKPIVVAKPFA